MKTGSKRGLGAAPGAAVLDAPAQSHASGINGQASETSWAGREPAPAGALHRAAAFDPDSYPTAQQDVVYRPRRGAGWRRLPRSVAGRILLGSGVLLVLGAVAAGGLSFRHFLLHDDRFLLADSDNIEIEGNGHLTRAQTLAIFGGDLGRNLFKVPLAERRSALEQLPWVSHASVMRLLPDRIRVSVTERNPVAFVRQGTTIGLVDGNGVLLDMPPEDAGDPHYSFPVLTGLSPQETPAQRNTQVAVYRRFMADLDSGPDKLTQQLSEVDVSNPEDVKALIPSAGSDILVHFGDEQFLNRYREYEKHLPEWKAQYPKLAAADMRYEGQIVLEMGDGANLPLNGDIGQPSAAMPGEKAELTPPALKSPVTTRPKALPVALKAPVRPADAAKTLPGLPRPGVAATAAVRASQPPPPPTGFAGARTASTPAATVPAVRPVNLGAAAASRPAAHPAPSAAKSAPAGNADSQKWLATHGGGKSAANAKMFAALAAERRAADAKARNAGHQ